MQAGQNEHGSNRQEPTGGCGPERNLHSWKRAGRTILVGLVVLAFAACASPPIKHEYTIADENAFDPATMKKVLLAPLNAVAPVPTGLEAGNNETYRLVVRHLESKGLVVEPIAGPAFRKAINQSVDELRQRRSAETNASSKATDSERIGFGELVPGILERLESDADLLVAPNLAIRRAEYIGTSTLRWDGVTRRERGAGIGSMTGASSAASLLSVIYDRSGKELLKGYGGLDLIFQLNLKLKKYVMRDDLLQDTKNLKQGVCISFHPFFGLEETCRD